MAAGKIAGQSTSAIARAEGVSRDWAAKELGSVECRQILVSLVNGTLERMAQLFKTVLDTIEAGMKADNEASAVGRGVGSPPTKILRVRKAETRSRSRSGHLGYRLRRRARHEGVLYASFYEPFTLR